MTIRCPGCGRAYDESLFEGGRTIHCACGTRVGAPVGVSRMRPDDDPRFMVDAMLGRLARWVRICGFDSAYEPDIPDERLVRRALEERRIVVTRDRRLGEEWRIGDLLTIESERPTQQLREVIEAYGLASRIRAFTRCLRCNALLEPMSRREVDDRVPQRVLESGVALTRCPSCNRVYWSGSHVERMRRMLRRVVERT